MKAQKQFGSMILIFTAIMMAIGFGKANAQVYKVSTDMRVSGELEVIDSIKTRVGYFQWNGSAWESAGVGIPKLSDVLFQGNNTDGYNINISDGDQIYFDNGSRIRKGITDMSNGGAKGVALVCSIDYELKWEAGRLYILQQDGFTIREVRYNFTMTPTVNDDATKGFVIGSKWVMDDGLEYICADSATGAAVWNYAARWEQVGGIITTLTADTVFIPILRVDEFALYSYSPDSGDVLTAVDPTGNAQWQAPAYSSGTYTPSVTNMVNIASTTTIKSNWSRVGNIVTVAGYVSVTTSGNGLAQLGLSLPVASNFTTRYEGSGTLTTTKHFGEIYSHVSNDNVVLEFQHSGSTGADEFRYVFVYEIL
jgi:hypothetical protein